MCLCFEKRFIFTTYVLVIYLCSIMSKITSQQLDHLAKLSRIQLTDEDREILLPQLEQILLFVGHLDEVDVSDVLDGKVCGDS